MKIKDILFSTALSLHSSKALSTIEQICKQAQVGIALPISGKVVYAFGTTYYELVSDCLSPIADVSGHTSEVYDASGQLLYTSQAAQYIAKSGVVQTQSALTPEAVSLISAYVVYFFQSQCAYEQSDKDEALFSTMRESQVELCRQNEEYMAGILSILYKAVNTILAGALTYVAEYTNTEDGSYAVLETRYVKETFHIVRVADHRVLEWEAMSPKARKEAIQSSLMEEETAMAKIQEKINC